MHAITHFHVSIQRRILCIDRDQRRFPETQNRIEFEKPIYRVTT